jgi:hypothetical protein
VLNHPGGGPGGIAVVLDWTHGASGELAMNLEEYFVVLAPNDIRLKGHRIGIETILYEYLHRGQTPDAIAEAFDTLTAEEVYATILYCHRNRR